MLGKPRVDKGTISFSREQVTVLFYSNPTTTPECEFVRKTSVVRLTTLIKRHYLCVSSALSFIVNNSHVTEEEHEQIREMGGSRFARKYYLENYVFPASEIPA